MQFGVAFFWWHGLPKEREGANQMSATKQRPEAVKKSKSKTRRRGNGLLLNVPQLARKLGESERSIRSWTDNGILKPIVLGYRSHRYLWSDVVSALEKRRV
jgi:hypothetical protein